MAVASAVTAKPCGMKKTSAASNHRKRDDGPFAAASAIQRIPTMAATLKRTRSRVRRARSRAMRGLAEPVDHVEPRQGPHEAVAVRAAVGRQLQRRDPGDASGVRGRDLPDERAPPRCEVEALDAHLEIAGVDVQTVALLVEADDIVLARPGAGDGSRLSRA